MELNKKGLKNRKAWEAAGYTLPQYDREEMIKRTREEPFWVHFGAGNIFRAFQANAVQKLLDTGELQKGIIVAEGYDEEIIPSVYDPFDCYSILVTFKADGSVGKAVTGSVAEALSALEAGTRDFSRLQRIFQQDSLQMASFTITEKGYALKNGRGEFFPNIQADFEAGPNAPASYMGRIAALLYARFLSGEKPLAMLSMDNCSANGDKLFQAVQAFAKAWEENKLVQGGFCAYVQNPRKVSFPWTMIDKITPRPDASVYALLEKDGIEGAAPLVTAKNTYTAAFVNAEECEYLVIEDDFPNGRPPLEKAGFLFTDRETVTKCERMKVSACLNPLHTALAVYGCLLGYTLIAGEMENPALKKLVMRLGYTEGLPAAVDPGILSPRSFLDAVVNVRIPNPFMPDTPQRIATDTSQKLSVRFGETIKAYCGSADPDLDVDNLIAVPLVFAGWLRYLMGVDDKGNPFALSADPLLETLCPIVQKISLGRTDGAEEILKPILQNAEIFGVNLYDAGLGERVLSYFKELAAGKGAVEAVLQKYTSEF